MHCKKMPRPMADSQTVMHSLHQVSKESSGKSNRSETQTADCAVAE